MYYILDALRLKDKKEAHEYLSESMHFPEHYGKNLDALYDCLRELKDVVHNIYSPKLYCLYFITESKHSAYFENRKIPFIKIQ